MSRQPKITTYTVIIPAYNEGSSITRCLDSIYNASLKSSKKLVRIIICLNGCTDNTADVISKWKKAPITVIESERGFHHAMNALITYSQKHFPSSALVKTDADSVLTRNALVFLFRQLDMHPTLVLAGGHPVGKVNNRHAGPWQRFVAATISIRSHYPRSEVTVKDSSDYHTYSDVDPLPGIGSEENRLKIYFHGRLWAVRMSTLIPTLNDVAIGEDVFLAGWIFNTYGKRSIRVDYRAKVYFTPNYTLRRHWKVYRRIHEDRKLIYGLPGFKDYAEHCRLRLNWSYIFRYVPLRDILLFVAYSIVVRLERVSFAMTRYKTTYWQYSKKEI